VISLILRAVTRVMLPLLILYSIFLLLRGHNEPGGGFAAGLVASSAFVLYALAFDVEAARQALQVKPNVLVSAGLLLSAGSGVAAVVKGRPFMTGLWTSLPLPIDATLAAGTPLLFDVGVFLVVIGISVWIFLNVAEE
jgi:multicomponent Na+:H+ antiporter subunit B